MLRIGPSGNSTAFYESGRKHTFEAAQWLREIGLNAYEYSFGRGVNISDETAAKIGSEMKKYDIALSGHAPYYINFANAEAEQIDKSIQYIIQSLKKTLLMGGNRVVFHAATQGKLQRQEALSLTKSNIERMLEAVIPNANLMASEVKQSSQDQDDSASSQPKVILCPETMGKLKQIGTVEEVVDICLMHPALYPCYDFGHINSYMGGGLREYDDYKRIIDYTFDKLGDKKTLNMHIHFSKIQYGSSGEIRHLTLEDEIYGPEYPPLARVIDEYKMTPVIICESKEIMSDDALKIKQIHASLRAK